MGGGQEHQAALDRGRRRGILILCLYGALLTQCHVCVVFPPSFNKGKACYLAPWVLNAHLRHVVMIIKIVLTIKFIFIAVQLVHQRYHTSLRAGGCCLPRRESYRSIDRNRRRPSLPSPWKRLPIPLVDCFCSRGHSGSARKSYQQGNLDQRTHPSAWLSLECN